MPFFTYIIQSQIDSSFYIGHSEDPEKRLTKHNNALTGFTSRKKPWKLVYTEEFQTKSEAIKREKFLKRQKNKEYVTKKELEKFTTDLFDELQKASQSEQDSMLAKRECMVLIKPKRHAPIIEFLPEGTFVLKLERKQHWVYVGYKSPMDSLPQHGWVRKKYLIVE